MLDILNKNKSLLDPQPDSKFLLKKNLILPCRLLFQVYIAQFFLTRHNKPFNLYFLVCMRLHSDENIHFASQRSSLGSFLMLLNWLLPSSVVGKNHTYTCPVGQLGKMNLWLSWTLPLEDHDHICIFIAPTEFSELTNVEYFYHLSFSIWNCKPMSIQNVLVSASPAKRTNPKRTAFPPAVSRALLHEFLSFLSLELD